MTHDRLDQIKTIPKPISQQLYSQIVVDIQLRQFGSEAENKLSE
ncbi:hypothetical protein [Dendronalium sp. ChiSLP03b]